MNGSISSAPAGEIRKPHILLVEDDDAARAAYSLILTTAGYDVTSAMDFRLALQILESEQPLDVLLVDIVMPGSVNGIALSRMARMRRPSLRVVYVTGYHILGAEREALGPILLKPVDDTRLIGAIRQVLADRDTSDAGL